ncbi:hypothetical protein [Microbacterium hydrocarbonoxydans]|uniref:Uncharacterized protein n=1 Tax=Microbacterium hydrocarbonoxydans TaxID=273678 RepID=A0A1H4KSQ7_9MICO|nr:hypothetical protein [Microbacterium hydrocarbonoxydans]SEB61236.1 hypothetical protein SAMN04489807_1520 [Microbacterium hydrocarbonoxydans]
MRSIPSDDHPILRTHRVLRPGFGTEAAVYGTILVSGLIAVSSAHGETSALVLLTVGVTVLVFWAAHIYAGTVARLGEEGGEHLGIRSALIRSVRHSLGMLSSAGVPALILLAGTTRLIPDEAANDVALWSGTAILAFLGFVAFMRRGSGLRACVLGAVATASFGVVFVALKAFVH